MLRMVQEVAPASRIAAAHREYRHGVPVYCGLITRCISVENTTPDAVSGCGIRSAQVTQVEAPAEGWHDLINPVARAAIHHG